MNQKGISIYTRVRKLPPKEWLEKLFEYRPEEGLFWKLRPPEHFGNEVDWYIWNKRFALKPAGTRAMKMKKVGVRVRDHCRVQIPHFLKDKNLKTFSVHRIAFAIMNVEVPTGMIIDHINQDAWDNRWCNLRLGTFRQNLFNTSGWKKRKRSHLPKGVYMDPRRENTYFSMLKIGDKYKRIGTWRTVEEARSAYLEKIKEVHGEFASAV